MHTSISRNLSSSVPASITSDFISNIAVHPSDKSICYVSLSNFSFEPRLWKVTNATATPVWTSISGDLPAGLPVNYIEIDPARPDEFLLAGTDYGLYVSTDGGVHWVKDNNIPNVVVQQVKVRPTDRRVFIFTHGRGLWTAVLDTNNVGIDHFDLKELNATVFPNPFSEQFTIKSDAQQLSATIRDLQGKIVFHDTELVTTQPVELSMLSSGIYFLELKSHNSISIKKLIKE